MVWKGVFALVLLAAAFGVLAGNANAQAQSCIATVSCGWYSFDSGCIPPLPPGVFNCQYGGPWTTVCQIMTLCPPQAAGDETCPTCGKAKPVAGAPISLATGNTYIEQTDIRVPGLGNGLTLVRTWNSKWPSTQNTFKVGFFGPNWRSTYEERVFQGSE